MEGTDQVLALRRVDPGLAPDRTVDLRQKARGHLHESHPPPQDGGGETDQVTDDPAAQGHDDVAPFDLLLQQPFHRPLKMRPDFVARPAAAQRRHAMPAAFSPAVSAGRCRPATFSSVITATRGRARSGCISAPAASSSPWPDMDVVGARPSGT